MYKNFLAFLKTGIQYFGFIWQSNKNFKYINIFIILLTIETLVLKNKFILFFYIYSNLIKSCWSLNMIIIILLKIVIILLFILLIIILVSFFTLLERKIIAVVQERKGPNIVGLLGLLQPISDGFKLILKEQITPTKAYKNLFLVASIISFVSSFLIWMVIPFFLDININVYVDVLFIFSIMGISSYGLIFAGWSSNSNYALLGALRALAQFIAYEVILGLLLLNIYITNNSLNIFDIVNNQKYSWNLFLLLWLFIILFILILAETNRTPFDLPEAEGELVSGFHTEYSSFLFALFSLAEYCTMLFWSNLMTLLLLGGWHSILDLTILLPFKFIYLIILSSFYELFIIHCKFLLNINNLEILIIFNKNMVELISYYLYCLNNFILFCFENTLYSISTLIKNIYEFLIYKPIYNIKDSVLNMCKECILGYKYTNDIRSDDYLNTLKIELIVFSYENYEYVCKPAYGTLFGKFLLNWNASSLIIKNKKMIIKLFIKLLIITPILLFLQYLIILPCYFLCIIFGAPYCTDLIIYHGISMTLVEMELIYNYSIKIFFQQILTLCNLYLCKINIFRMLIDPSYEFIITLEYITNNYHNFWDFAGLNKPFIFNKNLKYDDLLDFNLRYSLFVRLYDTTLYEPRKKRRTLKEKVQERKERLLKNKIIFYFYDNFKFFKLFNYLFILLFLLLILFFYSLDNYYLKNYFINTNSILLLLIFLIFFQELKIIRFLNNISKEHLIFNLLSYKTISYKIFTFKNFTFKIFKLENFKLENFKLKNFKLENFKLKNFKLKNFKLENFTFKNCILKIFTLKTCTFKIYYKISKKDVIKLLLSYNYYINNIKVTFKHYFYFFHILKKIQKTKLIINISDDNNITLLKQILLILIKIKIFLIYSLVMLNISCLLIYTNAFLSIILSTNLGCFSFYYKCQFIENFYTLYVYIQIFKIYINLILYPLYYFFEIFISKLTFALTITLITFYIFLIKKFYKLFFYSLVCSVIMFLFEYLNIINYIYFWLIVKTCLCLFLFIIIRATLPRYRYDQLIRLGWKIFLPLGFSIFFIFCILKYLFC